MFNFILIKSVVLSTCLFMALYYDVKEQKIKNFITFPAAFFGLVINFFEHGSEGLVFSLKGWIIPVVILMILYYINVMGAGDIKLFAAIGAIMGLTFVTYSFIFTVYIGGIIALVLLIKRREFFRRMKYLTNYFRFTLFTCKITKYVSQEDKSSKFILTTAIVPGTIIQLLITIYQLKVINFI